MSSFAYFRDPTVVVPNKTQKTAASHIIKWFPQRARHLFDFHVSPQTYSAMSDHGGGLKTSYFAPRPELSASLSFQVTMWSSGSAVGINESPMFGAIDGIGTAERFDDLADLASDQGVALPNFAKSVDLSAHPPFVTVTLFANYDVNTVENLTTPFTVHDDRMMHVSASHLPISTAREVTTIGFLGPVAICRTIMSQSYADQLYAAGLENNLFHILTRQKNMKDEDALLYFSLRIRQRESDIGATTELTGSSYVDTRESNIVDILCYNRNGRVHIGDLYVDAIQPTRPWSLTSKVKDVRVDYQPKQANTPSAFLSDELMVERVVTPTSTTESTIATSDAHRSSSLATNQRTHIGIGLSHDQLNKLSINYESMRHMHRWGFLHPVISGTNANPYRNDYRRVGSNLDLKTDFSATVDRFWITTEYDPNGSTNRVSYFAPPSTIPSALLGLAFYTGNDFFDTKDSSNATAVGIISDDDLVTRKYGSYHYAGGQASQVGLVPEIKQRVTGTFGLEATSFFTCLISSPLSASYIGNTQGSTRLFDDRYNISLMNGGLGGLRPEAGPDSVTGDNYVWVDTGRAEIFSDKTSEQTFGISAPGVFTVRAGFSATLAPHQFLHTREIPKPLHMDHMTRNDPDSGFDVG